MPILSASQIHAVLKEENGGSKQLDTNTPEGKKSLQGMLDNANLIPEELLCDLKQLTIAAETGSVRLRAIETALQLNGLLKKDTGPADFSVTINIIDGQFANGVNPILLPRQ